MRTNIKNSKKANKGITLIALVITIIVLLILAGISIAMLIGENGILTQAQNAKQETENASTTEKIKLEVSVSFGTDGNIDIEQLNNNLSNIEGIEGIPITSLPAEVTLNGNKMIIDYKGNIVKSQNISEVKNKEVFNKNTVVKDNYWNFVTIPEGFKIAEDSADNVTGGVVIEDISHGATAGSQFVWIPVGNVYTSEIRSEANKKIITLGMPYLKDKKEENSRDTESLLNYGNTIAKDIEEFKLSASAEKNGGYYIGRYEARVENATLDMTGWSNAAAPNTEWTGYTGGQLVVKSNAQVFNYITQNKAAKLSRNMYTSSSFTSDLMNSYAWDTAIVFVQEFDDRKEEQKSKPYKEQSSLNTDEVANQGTNNLDTSKQDKICNIWDIASNASEWMTTTSNATQYPCVSRGGRVTQASNIAGGSFNTSTIYASSDGSFRPLLYL